MYVKKLISFYFIQITDLKSKNFKILTDATDLVAFYRIREEMYDGVDHKLLRVGHVALEVQRFNGQLLLVWGGYMVNKVLE